MSSDDKKNATPSPAAREFDDDVVMTFPQRMMEILSNEENSHAITWLPHGKGFIIYNKKKFASEVLPRYFKASKFTSFTRKLNRWGFVRVTQRGPEMGAYYHKFFQRDNPSLCLRMTCETSKPPAPRPEQAAMLPPQVLPTYTPPVGTEAALIAQNSLLQQQLLMRMEHERAMSNLYMQMLQQKGIASSTPMPMVNPPTMNNNATDAAAPVEAQAGDASSTTTPNSSGRANDVRKAKAA